MIRLLMCDTWVTKWKWFVYANAKQHQEKVPFLLVDRSPCTDPFLEPYASSEERQPIISCLCRVNQIKQYLQKGNTFIYITRMKDRRVCRDLGISTKNKTPYYLGIAALTVAQVHESHAEAAAAFESRRNVVAPVPTRYPPNLAHNLAELRTQVAVPRESCIVSLKVLLKRGEKIVKKRVHHTPDDSTDEEWWEQVKFYHGRQKKEQLPAAECCLVQVDGREVLQLDPMHAPVFTPADWGGEQMNIAGIELDATKADWFYQQIAHGR